MKAGRDRMFRSRLLCLIFTFIAYFILKSLQRQLFMQTNGIYASVFSRRR